ncbi:hypothetical protein AQV86_02595 [Nanohaloarchaea archaeon SG9]|nr:hypothetical protein AQV86_02595 [Nanohaloarchaea archaeon SG9]
MEERLPDLPEWKEAEVEEKFDEVREIFQENKEILRKDQGESDTQKEFIDRILEEILGHYFVTEKSKTVGGERLKPDYLFLKDKDQQKEILNSDEKDYFSESYVVADAKDWDRPLDSGEKTDHSNPKYQIFNYVDRTRIKWGILTNGRKWRLYCYDDLDTKTFYEVDLINLITKPKDEEALEDFKLFYLLFRQEAFLPKESGFADKVLEGSEKFSKELEDNLKEKIYSALEVAGRGFINTPENNLEKTPENIELAQKSSLILLYRLLFILNAESRGLLPVGDKAYDEALSLKWYKEKIIDKPNHVHLQKNTIAWNSRITNLFSAVNSGQDLHSTEIPPYNGGLFDPENGEENRFLEENALRGNYVKEIIKLLALRNDEDKLKTVDYKSFNIRHLGSIYEGLLEHKLKEAEENLILKSGEWIKDSETDIEFSEADKKVEKGGIYLTNESGERKATGSYYTPDYIVEYIVENTVGPKVEEKLEDQPTLEEIEKMDEKEQEKAENQKIASLLELNVCDPAMGSGHFLTEATECIAKEIYHGVPLKHQDIEEDEEGLNWAKRQVVQNCIYGVDINPLAVELGKLSLWIETMAEGKPLNFLDHHLKHGNSLIGSNFDNIFTHPTENQKRLDNEDFNFSPEEARENFQRQYLEIEQMPENTVQQIHEKEQAYKKFISNNTLYQQFQQLANIHTRQFFSEEANSSDYENFLINIGNPGNPFEDTEWFKNAQSDAEDRNYFHWQLEFPQVFFGELKEKVEQKEKYTHTHTHTRFNWLRRSNRKPSICQTRSNHRTQRVSRT